MKIVLPLNILLLLFSYGCSKQTESINTAANRNGFSQSEYKIISSVLEEFVIRKFGVDWHIPDKLFSDFIGIHDSLNIVVLQDSTFLFGVSPDNYTRFARPSHKEHDIPLLKKLIELNKNKYNVVGEDVLNLKAKTLDVRLSTEFRQGSIGSFWESFYKFYPDAVALVGFSIPAFDTKNNEAVIYMDFMRQGKWGEGNLLWLMKIDGKWTITEIDRTWIS